MFASVVLSELSAERDSNDAVFSVGSGASYAADPTSDFETGQTTTVVVEPSSKI